MSHKETKGQDNMARQSVKGQMQTGAWKQTCYAKNSISLSVLAGRVIVQQKWLSVETIDL